MICSPIPVVWVYPIRGGWYWTRTKGGRMWVGLWISHPPMDSDLSRMKTLLHGRHSWQRTGRVKKSQRGLSKVWSCQLCLLSSNTDSPTCSIRELEGPKPERKHPHTLTFWGLLRNARCSVKSPHHWARPWLTFKLLLCFHELWRQGSESIPPRAYCI